MDSLQRRQSRRPKPDDWTKLWSEHQRIFTRLDQLEARLGHRFADPTRLYEALTHRSALMELGLQADGLPLPWNERVEFLGDAVLSLCVSRRLMEYAQRYAQPEMDDLAEGDLSRLRAALVNEESLADLARQLELGTFLLLGKGAVQSGGRGRDSLLADGLEALIGAVFQDGGYAAADGVVGHLFDPLISGDLRGLLAADYKTKLQELTQDKLKQTPRYEVITAHGPDHDKVFEVRVVVGTQECGRGTGGSKKRASQEAARQAIDNLLQSELVKS